MRINVYSQELTNEVQVEEKESNTGLIYTAVRLMLHSSPMLHHPDQTETVECSRCAGRGWHMIAGGPNSDTCSECKGSGKIIIQKDDDRSGITFWLPKSKERREELATAFEEMASKVREARPETGLD